MPRDKADIAAALDAVTESNKTKQQILAENLVSDALARGPFAVKTIIAVALTMQNDGASGEGDAAVIEQKLIQDFNQRQKTDEE